MIVFFCILNTSGIICAPRIPVPRRKQPNSSDRNPRTTRNGVHHLTQPESSFAMSILFHQPNMSNEHSYMCAQRHTENHNYKHKQKVAPYVAPIGTWGDFEDSGGGSCATETDTCDARFLSYPFLSSCFDVLSLMIFHITYDYVASHYLKECSFSLLMKNHEIMKSFGCSNIFQ